MSVQKPRRAGKRFAEIARDVLYQFICEGKITFWSSSDGKSDSARP